MVAPPSLLEKKELKQVTCEAKKKQQKLLEDNKLRAQALLLSISVSTVEKVYKER